MNLAKIKAVLAGLGYLAIVSLAAYNLRGELFGSSVPLASANSTPVATAPVAATPEPAVQSASNSGSASAQNDQKTPQQASQPTLKTEKPAAPGKQASAQEKTSARTQQSLVPVAGNGSVAAGERLPTISAIATYVLSRSRRSAGWASSPSTSACAPSRARRSKCPCLARSR